MIDKGAVLLKVAAMFSPAEQSFLGYAASDVIHGPDDRAMVGCTTCFPKLELVEDFGFTMEEAEFFIATVKAVNALKV